jgi:putative SOS response-associated peptidase YedK
MAKIHNKKKRMPVILDKKNDMRWINTNINKEETMRLLKPYDENKMTAYTISKLIISKNKEIDIPQVLEPFQYNNLEPLTSQKNLF